jgi:cellulose biosynthesis protein BcsQ
MTAERIRERIKSNMASAKLAVQDLRVQPDRFAGWRVAVVSPGFDGLSSEQRQEKALGDLRNLKFQWLDLLTPDERIWSGDLPINSDLEDIPMWPEALARIASDEPIVFPSDLDEDLARPIVATFYSLRGGVGRSTALAYTAQLLASRGHSVLCVDMDLEAPGLAALVGREDEVQEGYGLLSILLALDQGEQPDILQHVIRLSETDELYCLPAGVPNADYARRLRLLDPEAWYREERNPLREFLDRLPDLPFKPEVVLMDARTGITPMSAPLLFDLSDLAIVTFFPHPQAYAGTRALVQGILNARTRRIVDGRRLTPELRFLASPIPPGRGPETQRYRLRAIDWVAAWLSPLQDRRPKEASLVEVEEIVHFVPYRELIATSDRILPDGEAWRTYEPIADWLERFIPAKSEERPPARLPELKPSILASLEFSAGTAETQENFLDSFVQTELIAKALAPEKPLVLGRKGTGKTAIFRRLVEGSDRNAVAVLCPAAFRAQNPWVLFPEGFQALERFFDTARVGWREFWATYTALACFLSLQRQDKTPALPDAPLTESVQQLAGQSLNQRKVVSCLQKMLSETQIGLLAWDWLQSLDSTLGADLLAVFDGLDTGFGNSPEERERRARAIEGLFSFVMDREASLQRMRFKILLREDIWRRLRFENKSHLFGRSVQLAWRSQADYAKTVLKQALQNRGFASLVAADTTLGPIREFDRWSDDAVFQVWNILVGERMKGANTAYTRNWVWNRLADGNGDHGPRSLLQLFREATAWEVEEYPKSPYDRSVVRPRALAASLSTVSREALDALIEEFRELEDIMSKLRDLGRSPVEASELHSFGELNLAREVGLLAVYEGTEEEVRRFRVPDLYRNALGMTRRGPA